MNRYSNNYQETMMNTTPQKKKTVLVTGATGAQGGAVSQALLAAGHHVRAFTRNPMSDQAMSLADNGAEMTAGNFDEPATMAAAAHGADAVYLMGGPMENDPETEIKHSIAAIDTIVNSGSSHIVYASVASALDDTGVAHFESKAIVEHHLRKLQVPHTVLAPSAFLSDLTEPPFLEGTGSPHWKGLREGVYAFCLPGQVPLQMVSLADLGEFARLVIEQPARFDRQRIELASVDVAGSEIAGRLSKALGKKVHYQAIPLDYWEEIAGADGLKMAEFFRKGGYTIDLGLLHTAYPEIKWTTVDDWITSHNWDITELH